jgi:hypothetical protein
MQVFSHPMTSKALQGLQSNFAAKLLFVNVATMAVPRTIIDYQRNKYAGQETGFYEGYSLFSNYAMPGLLALGTASVLKKFNNPFKVNTSSWVSNESIEALAQHYRVALKDSQKAAVPQKQTALAKIEAKTQINSKDTRECFLKQTLSHLQGKRAIDGSLTRLSPELVNNFAQELEALAPGQKPDLALARRIGEALGSYDRVELLPHASGLHALAGGKSLALQPQKFLEHLSSLSHEFKKAGNSTDLDRISQKLCRGNIIKAVVSLSVVASLGFFAQFINKWITRKRTGQTGFVGTMNFSSVSQPSASHQSQPSATQSPSFAGLASSQFLPTAEQLKYVIYPAGIFGKMLASRSLDELRETSIKASFAYFNLLFIPNIVENMVAHAAGHPHAFSKTPNLEPFPENSGIWARSKRYFQTVNRSTVRSYEDLAIYAQQLGKKLSTASDTELAQELKTLLRKPESLMAELKTLKTPMMREKAVAEAVMSQLRGVKNKAVLAGLFYSALTLGVGLNLLNIYITNRKHRRDNNAMFDQKEQFA